MYWHVYEWEQLFLNKTAAGLVETIQTGVSGEIESLEECKKGITLFQGWFLLILKRIYM
jgi:hypothetical protein